MELNVNRNNKALQFYEHMGMRKLWKVISRLVTGII